MTINTVLDGRAAKFDPRVRMHILNLMMALAPPQIILLNVVIVAPALWLHWGHASFPDALTWIIAIALVATYNIWARAYYLRNRKRFWDAERWTNFLVVCFALNGVAWGFGAALIYQPDYSPRSLFAAGITLVVAATASTGQGGCARLTWGFLVPALAPLALKTASYGSADQIALSVLIVFVLLTLGFFTSRQRMAIESAIALRFSNHKLIERLAQREAEMIEAQERAAQAETRLSDAIERLDEPFVLWDEAGRPIRANAAARHLFRDVPALPPEGDLRDAARRILGADAACADGEIDCGRFELNTKDDRIVRFALHRTVAGDTAMVGVDLTEARQREAALRETQDKLRRAKEQAELANRAKSSFLARMSHELRTPLNAILGFAEIIRDNVGGDTAATRVEYAGYIYDSGAHLLELINAILDLSKIESGKVELEEGQVDIAEAVASALRLVKARSGEAQPTIRVEVPVGMPRLWADQKAVRQMLINLAANAVKFTPPEGQVAVSARVEDGGIVVQVADDGVGIAERDLQKAMEPFGQIVNPLTRSANPSAGVGLGVPIVKSLIELHGGTLELRSRVGEGTIATLRFPPERSVA